MESKQQPEPVDFVVAGHICRDVIPIFKDRAGQPATALTPGTLVKVGRAIMATGGSVANTGVALHRLGFSTRMMGKVGADKFGEYILDSLSTVDSGLVGGMVIDETVETSYSIVISPPGVDRLFLHNPGANDTYRASDVRDDQLLGARYFHFGYPPLMRETYSDGGKELAQMLLRVKAHGVTTSLDMAYPDPESEAGHVDWPDWLRQVMPMVDIFLPSFDELYFMLNGLSFEQVSAQQGVKLERALLSDMAEAILAMGAAIVVLKLGDRGLYMKASDNPARLEAMGSGRPADLRAWCNAERYTPCFKAAVVGTTGAGDCTIAGFLGAVSMGLDPDEVMTMAVAVGGFNVENADATSGIPQWADVQERVDAGWVRHPPDLPGFD